MSFIDDKTSDSSYSFDQNEEHFEFTPQFNDDDDDDVLINDDEFITSNTSFNNNNNNSISTNGSNDNHPSLKFIQRNSIRNSSFRKSTPMKNKHSNNQIMSQNSLNGMNNSLNCDSDNMLNDNNSMEEYIIHLTEKLKKLQDQVQFLREGQEKNEEKYSTMKKENSTLHNKINYLEEQIRDIELQSEDKRKEVEQRFRESMARLEREKAQELENCVTRICSLQKESVEAKEEIKRHQQTIERLQDLKEKLEIEIHDKNDEIQSLKDEIRKLKEIIRLKNEERDAIDSSLIEALNYELSSIERNHNLFVNNNDHNHQNNNHDNDSEMYSSIHSELEQQLRILKDENKTLKENNEELTAQLLNNHLIEGKSLLKEGEAISSLASEISDLNLEQLKTALREQQDVNAKLRSYIDGILLNIVENYPQLLEVKSNGTAKVAAVAKHQSSSTNNGNRKRL